MQDIRHVSSTKNNMIPRYSATARDAMDNSTYYLYQEAIESNELWGETRQMVLQHLDANDTFVRKMVLVPFVPGIVPYFFMDFKLTSDAVYCMFVSIQPLIFSTFMHNQKRYGGREIVLMKINKTNFQYIAHTGVSSVGDDNGFRLYPETDGSVFIVGTTNANISSPFSTQYIEQNLTTVFVSRFQSFGISSFITQPSLSNASGYRIQQLKNFSIVFTQDLAILYQLIEVYLLDWVRIPAQIGGANSVIATAPPGGGNGECFFIFEYCLNSDSSVCTQAWSL
ncbi:hypothetical protein BKA69DRAFT_942729 [Paraphysoderma sedebokerense]|nr:hypothetical protein BKA69DRAFT_942729 [Paraphysoderma sedebokerense]